MTKYYVAEIADEENFTALNKARKDVEQLYNEYGLTPLNTYLEISKSKTPNLSFFKELLKSLKNINSDDYIYLQYPYHHRRNKFRRLITYLKKIKNNKLVAIIHDIDSLRYSKDQCEINKEIKYLNNFDYIISHNEKMSSWLSSNGCKAKLIELEVFDYLINENLFSCNKRKTDVVFAGNLERGKSEFIYKLVSNADNQFKMNLYGPNFNGEIKNKQIKYHGSFPADELINKIEGKFGLIWDGEELNSCSGLIGEYTKYNNPHKFSMYLATGLPIICWSNMAISSVVKEKKIGICIDNLNEIDNVLNSINDKEYELMVQNVKLIQGKIRNGYFTKKALRHLDTFINKR